LLGKEITIPSKSNKILFLVSPLLNLCCSFFGWFPLVLQPYLLNKTLIFNYGIFVNLFFSTLGIYFLFLIGWSSNSKYSMLGAIRGISQMIAYEIAITVIIMPVILLSSSFNYGSIYFTQFYTT